MYILLLFSFSRACAQDCDEITGDTVIGVYFRVYQRDAAEAVADSSKLACKLWVEKLVENGKGYILFECRQRSLSTSIICTMAAEAYAEFIFVDTIIKCPAVISDWSGGNFRFVIRSSELLKKLAAEHLVGFKGYTAHLYRYEEDISFTFQPQEAAKLMQAFKCLQVSMQ